MGAIAMRYGSYAVIYLFDIGFAGTSFVTTGVLRLGSVH